MRGALFACGVVVVLVEACGAVAIDAGDVRASRDGGSDLATTDDLPLTREQAERWCAASEARTPAWNQRCLGIEMAHQEGWFKLCVATALSPGVTRRTADDFVRCAEAPPASCDRGEIQCVTLLGGTLPNGARCKVPAQCASGMCIGASALFPACGTCGEPLAAGSTCRVNDVCVTGYRCDAECPLGSDDNCNAIGTCSALPDDGPTPTKDAGNVERAIVGEPCTDRKCIDNLECDATTQRCVPLAAAGSGEPCRREDHTALRCPDTFYCPMLEDGTQRCFRFRKEGESCGPTDAATRCEWGLRCVDSRCQLDWPNCP